MRGQRIWREVRWSVQQRGLWGTVKAAVGRLGRPVCREREVPHPFDQAFGTDTGGLIGGGQLGTGSANDRYVTAYVGVAPSQLRSLLKRWAESLNADEEGARFTFVDLGCGKGRALLVAGIWGFGRAVGVELNPELAAVAERNLALFEREGRLRRGQVRVLCDDAAGTAFPDGPLLIFLYNPFESPVVRQVMAALARHVEATGARVDLLYQHEPAEAPTRGDPRLSKVWSWKGKISDEDAQADPVGAAEQEAVLYRWVG